MPGKILVVDDNETNCQALVRLLRHGGHVASAVQSGEAALEWLGEQVPDLIILDEMMPGMTGMAVLRTIRTDTRLSSVPVVMFSALSDTKFQKYAIQEGANDYWVKGLFDYRQLKERVAQYLPS